MSKKLTILTLSDNPLAPTGVGTQTRYIIEGLLKTGKYRFISLAGAKTPDFKPMKTEEYGDDWELIPVKGYGDVATVRSMIRLKRPDFVWFMTDPRYWDWLWSIENEIRPLVPMVYYHVWDNYPYPHYNKKYYDSTDAIVTISKVTSDIVKTVAPDVHEEYLPHAVRTDIFKKMDKERVDKFRKQAFGDKSDRFMFFWNNKNQRRKNAASLIWWFKSYLEKVGNDKAFLILHTNPKERVGPDLEAVLKETGLVNGEVQFSTNKNLSLEELALFYNAADCVINVADAEGFGLTTFEALACETPIIVNMTGGLQEQVTDGKNWFGVGIEPASKMIMGSQDIPYIFEDRVAEEDVVKAMQTITEFTPEARAEMGKLGREYIQKNYNFEAFLVRWDEIFTELHEEFGSWDTRKGYKPWELLEVK